MSLRPTKIRFFILAGWLAIWLTLYLDHTNQRIALRRKIPSLQQTIIRLKEEKEEKRFVLEEHLHPIELLHHLDAPCFSHLTYPQDP